MNLYQFHFVDAAGVVTHRHSLKLPTNEAAIKLGQRMFAGRDCDWAVEVWYLNRLVHTETRPRVAARG